MISGWTYLYSGILCAMIAIPLSKLSNGFENFLYGALAVIFFASSAVLWVLAVKTIPLTTAYVVWIGIEVLLASIISYIWFGETFSIIKLLFIIMILAGSIGLTMISHSSE